MKFNVKLFRAFFIFNILIIISGASIFSLLLYRSYSRLKEENLYFINAFLSVQAENMEREIGRIYEEIIRSGAFRYIFDENEITRSFARRDIISKILTIKRYNGYIYEIRIQKGNDIIISTSNTPLQIDKRHQFTLRNNTLYRILIRDVNIDGIKVQIIFIINVNSVFSNFSNYFVKYYKDIAYIFDNNRAILFDRNGAIKILPVEIVNNSILIGKKRYLLLNNTDALIAPIRAAISFTDFYEGLQLLLFTVILFIIISGFVVFIVSKRLSYSLTRSVRRLSSVLSGVKKGKLKRYGQKVDIEEINILIDSYNIMIDRIQNFTHELEDEVERRTRIIGKQKEELEVLAKELKEAAITDMLTGVYNRRHLEEKLKEKFEIAKRNDLYMGIAVIDIDQFKDINDAYGHLCGDLIIKEVARIIKSIFKRASDAIFRYGGDEFVVAILHSENRKNEFFELLEKLREKVEATPFLCEGTENKVNVTVSIGFYFDKVKDKKDVEEMLKLADEIMYKVKRLGRNKVIIN